jgi:hypothetical protein
MSSYSEFTNELVKCFKNTNKNSQIGIVTDTYMYEKTIELLVGQLAQSERKIALLIRED